MVIDHKNYLEKLADSAKKYGITVRFGSLPDPERSTPVRGAFRATEIRLPKDNDEEALFVLIHAIGHIAQWTLFPNEQDVSYLHQNKTDSWTDEELKVLLKHEFDALPYSLCFLEQNGASELSEWYRQYFFADQKYIADIFRHNRYRPGLFWQLLGRVRRDLPEQVHNVGSRPLPSAFTTNGRDGFIHVI